MVFKYHKSNYIDIYSIKKIDIRRKDKQKKRIKNIFELYKNVFIIFMESEYNSLLHSLFLILMWIYKVNIYSYSQKTLRFSVYIDPIYNLIDWYKNTNQNIFQCVFRAEMHQNDFFYFLKIIFEISTSKLFKTYKKN